MRTLSMRGLSLLLLLSLACACGDDEPCGPVEDAPDIVASRLDGVMVYWQDWKSSPNNDCGEPDGPTSLTVESRSNQDETQTITLCLPRPDKLSGKTVDINDTELLRVIDVFAAARDDCVGVLNRDRETSGTIAFHGVCDDGLLADGYSLDLDISLPITIDCGGVVKESELAIEGAVRVQAILP